MKVIRPKKYFEIMVKNRKKYIFRWFIRATMSKEVAESVNEKRKNLGLDEQVSKFLNLIIRLSFSLSFFHKYLFCMT